MMFVIIVLVAHYVLRAVTAKTKEPLLQDEKPKETGRHPAEMQFR